MKRDRWPQVDRRAINAASLRLIPIVVAPTRQRPFRSSNEATIFRRKRMATPDWAINRNRNQTNHLHLRTSIIATKAHSCHYLRLFIYRFAVQPKTSEKLRLLIRPHNLLLRYALKLSQPIRQQSDSVDFAALLGLALMRSCCGSHSRRMQHARRTKVRVHGEFRLRFGRR